MLKDTIINTGELYVGRKAGERVLKCIETATKSIKIVSPYISAEFVDLLVEKAKQNIEVSLIISDDFSNKEFKRIDIFKKLIQQVRHINLKKQKLRKIGLNVLYFLYFTALTVFIYGYSHKFHNYLYTLLTIPFLGVIHYFIKSIRIFTYTYQHSLNFSITKTPYSDATSFNSDYYFTHAKMYLVDHSLAYLGSLNFTKMGFYKNYETRIKIDDLETIQKLENEFEYLFSNENTCYLDLNQISKAIFDEPPN